MSDCRRWRTPSPNVTRRRSRDAREPPDLYWNSPFGSVRWRRAERDLLSRWLSLANTWRNSAVWNCNACRDRYKSGLQDAFCGPLDCRPAPAAEACCGHLNFVTSPASASGWASALSWHYRVDLRAGPAALRDGTASWTTCLCRQADVLVSWPDQLEGWRFAGNGDSVYQAYGSTLWEVWPASGWPLVPTATRW